MTDTVIAGGQLLPDPSKAVDTLKKLREEGQEWVKILGDVGSEAKHAYEDIRRYIKGRDPVPANSTVIMYQHADGGGHSRGFNTGDWIANFRDIHWQIDPFSWKQWNDQVSSIKVLGGVVLVAYEHVNYGGNRLIVIGPSYVSQVPAGWNDTISSCIVLPANELKKVFP